MEVDKILKTVDVFPEVFAFLFGPETVRIFREFFEIVGFDLIDNAVFPLFPHFGGSVREFVGRRIVAVRSGGEEKFIDGGQIDIGTVSADLIKSSVDVAPDKNVEKVRFAGCRFGGKKQGLQNGAVFNSDRFETPECKLAHNASLLMEADRCMTVHCFAELEVQFLNARNRDADDPVDSKIFQMRSDGFQNP